MSRPARPGQARPTPTPSRTLQPILLVTWPISSALFVSFLREPRLRRSYSMEQWRRGAWPAQGACDPDPDRHREDVASGVSPAPEACWQMRPEQPYQVFSSARNDTKEPGRGSAGRWRPTAKGLIFDIGHRVADPPKLENDVPSEHTLITVNAAWDPDAGVWWIEESNLPGLRLEAETLEALCDKIPGAVADLLEDKVSEAFEVPIEIIAQTRTH